MKAKPSISNELRASLSDDSVTGAFSLRALYQTTLLLARSGQTPPSLSAEVRPSWFRLLGWAHSKLLELKGIRPDRTVVKVSLTPYLFAGALFLRSVFRVVY